MTSDFQKWLAHTHPAAFAGCTLFIEEIANEWSDLQVEFNTESLEQENRELKKQVINKDAVISELRLESSARFEEIRKLRCEIGRA